MGPSTGSHNRTCERWFCGCRPCWLSARWSCWAGRASGTSGTSGRCQYEALGGSLGRVCATSEGGMTLRRESTLASMLCAVALVGATASAAFAGEVTGNGKPTAGPEHASSICVYSGQNDTPNAPGSEGGRVQSYGQLLKAGLKGVVPSPGVACRGGSNIPGQP